GLLLRGAARRRGPGPARARHAPVPRAAARLGARAGRAGRLPLGLQPAAAGAARIQRGGRGGAHRIAAERQRRADSARVTPWAGGDDTAEAGRATTRASPWGPAARDPRASRRSRGAPSG